MSLLTSAPTVSRILQTRFETGRPTIVVGENSKTAQQFSFANGISQAALAGLQSRWKTSLRSLATGDLSGLVFIMSAMKFHHWRTMGFCDRLAAVWLSASF